MTREDGLNVFFVLESESGWMDGMGFDGYSQEGPFLKKRRFGVCWNLEGLDRFC